MPKLIRASKEDFDKAEAQKILDDINKEEKDFDKQLKKSNAAYRKLFYPKSDVSETKFNKLAKDYKESEDKAIEQRRKINKLKEDFKKLTGTETFRAHTVGLTASTEEVAFGDADLFDSTSLRSMIVRELNKYSWLKAKVVEKESNAKELTIELKETPELGLDTVVMKRIVELHKKIDQKARQQGFYGIDTMLLMKNKSTAHLIMGSMDGD